MPITVREDVDGVDLSVRFEGQIRPEDIMDYFTDLTSRIESFDGKRALLEAERVRLAGISYHSMMELSKATEQRHTLLNGSRTAFVAHQAVVFGVVRMYISIRDPGYEFSVFRDRDEAIAWLQQA